MKIGIDDSDIKKLEMEINKLVKQSPQVTDNILKQTVSHIEGDARQNAPTGVYPRGSNRTGGWLKKNIKKGKDSEGYFVTSHADYSLWVEYGNRWWGGKSFFRPAIERGQKYLEQQIGKARWW